MRKSMFVIIFILYGFYNFFTELILRFNNLSWRHTLYYLIPIRAHMLLCIISIFLIVYLLFYERTSNKLLKLIGVVLNLAFIALWFDTIGTA